MNHLDACQRRVLACSLVPLLDLMQPDVRMSANAGISTNTNTHLESLLFSAGVTCDNKVTPHPAQGGERIMEAYLEEMKEAECIWRFRYVSQACT